MKYNKPVKTVPLRHILDTNHDDAFKYVNTILKILKCEQSKERFSLPNPQVSADETQHRATQKRILQELLALHKFERLNPEDNQNSYHKFLSYFDWTDSTLDKQTHKATEELLVEFHDIFAKQRFDIGVNIDFKVKPILIDGSPARSQN